MVPEESKFKIERLTYYCAKGLVTNYVVKYNNSAVNSFDTKEEAQKYIDQYKEDVI